MLPFLIIYLFNFFLIFSDNPEINIDKKIFILDNQDYHRKIYFEKNFFGADFFGDISYFYFSKPSFLSKKCIVYQYVQQVID